MAVSNAERQARYRQRLKQRASGVTVDDIVRAARLMHALAKEEDGDNELPDWDDLLHDLAKRPSNWTQWLPEDPEKSYSPFGPNAQFMRSVAKVVDAVFNPPPPQTPVRTRHRHNAPGARVSGKSRKKL